ncbi:PREDICTED: histone-lysine N-methyltransferase SUVR4 isoform X3 [Populus euphratica]|uniref:Histone-lysine N-methyltransferase SUVR4 isoform X3 n=1 Tax=Populus euphratica TaxID=75702 RepID=A0AAJ6Y0X6_POPEU|nr:PREDICTED: histone-lysine N-methyltransferase SUVR4 isoform X3 [Populus euphratica]
MANRERASCAFKATRALGIRDEEVKPVLLNLLKLFDMKWELIEAEDYRALIDAYFESKESKMGSDEKSLMEHSVYERPSKIPHLEQQKDQISSSTDSLSPVEKMIFSSMAPKDSTCKGASCAFSSEQLAVEPRSSHPRKEKMPSNCHTRVFIKQRTKQSVSDEADFAEPPAAVHPGNVFQGSFVGSTNGNNLVTRLGSQCDASSSKDRMYCNSNVLIASSTSGEVKISLNCDSAVRCQNFKVPDFNSVLKYLEDKYLKTHKLVTPEFSMKTLFKDLCECYVQVGQLHDPLPNNKALRIDNSDMVVDKKASSSFRLPHSSKNLLKAKHKATACDKKRSVRSLNDITKGAENVKISLVDESGNEDFPKFTYIPQNIIYQNAYVQISLARIADVDCCSSCSGDCLSSRIPCACARETGGEFAYTPKGLLKDDFLTACVCMRRAPKKDHFVYCQDCPLERSKNEDLPEPCKGHLLRKFIKECWRKCGCHMTCGNRVVQRGITCDLQVFMTPQGKGWGLRTLQDLPKGSFICEYVGEILTNTELYERNIQIQNRGNNRHTYPVTLDADWGSEKVLRDEEALCLDATFSGNVARFINHRCHDGNLIDIPVEVETPDRHYYHLAFFTTRDVTASEELTWDYGIDFDDYDHPIKAFRCSCGSAYCRGN